MELNGQVSVYDYHDPMTGLTIRLADYDPILTVKLASLGAAALHDVSLKKHLDKFNNRVLDQMDLITQGEGEPPLYRWVRSMKVLNRLSFEDGTYNIPENLAAAIVRSKDAALFIRLLGG